MKPMFDCLHSAALPYSGTFPDPFVDFRRPCPPFQPTPFDKLKSLHRRVDWKSGFPAIVLPSEAF